MLFKDVEHRWKLSIRGSITHRLKNITADTVFEEIFNSWYKDKFEEVEGKLQYVKIITDERLDIDDIRHQYRKIEKIPENDVNEEMGMDVVVVKTISYYSVKFYYMCY